MVVTDYNEQFLDKRGTDHLIDELKAYIDSISTGNVDLSDYVTKSELQAKLDALDINIDLSAYATKEELNTAINSIDLSAYAKKTDIPSLDAYAKKSDIPDVSGYLTSIPEEYVTDTELNAKGYLTEHQDLSAYALKTEIPTVPSLDGYATTEYVDNAIANVPSGGNVDLSNYYTKEETNALIPSTEGFATKQYVDNAVSNIPTTDLTNYYTKAETYSKTEVDTLVANSGGSSSGGSSGGASGITYAYDTEIATGDTWINGKPIYMKVFHIDALPTKPKGISMKQYYEQSIFADQIVSVNTIWKQTNSNGDTYIDGNSVISPSDVATSSSYVGGNVNDFIIGRETWVKVSNFNQQSTPTFSIWVGRGAGHKKKKCEVPTKCRRY